ncbi:MAG TPA: hypothetical protein VJS64_06080 [Pyrinomonadaceae bacterium]|nr:hypothetical protein [Pyrinomonadaceae bacterium]
MKTTLGFLTEEGRTRNKNAARRVCVYATFMFLIAGASGYAVHRYWVSPDLSPLQRVYLKQYLKSTYRSYLPNARSRYTTLTRTIADPQTKKDVALAVVDDQADPVLDDQGRIKFDPSHRPIFRIKRGVPFKRFFWNETIASDTKANEWFRTTIYDGKSIPNIWRPAWLGATLIFLFGTFALAALDSFAQRRYLKGEPLRGTRELLPKAYAREHRKHLGYEFTVYATT